MWVHMVVQAEVTVFSGVRNMRTHTWAILFVYVVRLRKEGNGTLQSRDSSLAVESIFT